ncbi:MAG: ABC transporter permease [Tumebacillaceae bacterium]
MRGKQIFLLVKKELLGIVRDRKTVVMLLATTLLLYPLMMGFFTMIQKNQQEKFQAEKPRIVVESVQRGAPFVEALQKSSQFQISDSTDPVNDLKAKKIDAVLHLSEVGSDNVALKVDYDERFGSSKAAADKIQALADSYKQQVVLSRLQAKGFAPDVLEPIQVSKNNVSSNTGGFISTLLPYFLAIGLISGSLNLGVEITAGEKERGTITTLLVAQFSRTEIALGKLLTTLGMAILAVLLNLVSLWISFGVVAKQIGGDLPSDMFSNFGVTTVLQLLMVMLPLGCMISAVIVFLGTYARNSKEGNVYNMPLLFLVMGLGFASSSMDANVATGLYAVPFLGPLLAIKQVMLSTGNITGLLITMASSLLYTALLIVAAVKLYNREEVMFRT